MRQQRERFGAAQEQQVVQAKTDLEVAKQGIEALKLVKQAKLEGKKAEDEHEMAMEAQRLQLRGSASVQALVATLDGEKADRILKLAELEMRKGLSVEQAMAMVAEKSPEIAPAIAAAMRAKYAKGPEENSQPKES
jgi:DNA polymerase III delta prime subunit